MGLLESRPQMFDLAQKAHPKQMQQRKDIIQFLNKNYTFDDVIQMEEIKI